MPRLLSLLLLLPFSFSCAVETMPTEILPGSGVEVEGKIFGGSAPDSPEHDAVVGLHQTARGGRSVYVSPFCSGTLITEDVVLTAAHCLSGMAPSKLMIYVGDNPSLDLTSHLYSVTEIWVHPGYVSSTILNDVALARLSRPITESVTPVPALPASAGLTSADVGALINFAGFGITETGTSGVKLQVDGTIDALGCHVTGCPSAGDTATQFSYEQPVSGPCSGDSGGPAFIYRTSGTYVAGLTSYGDAACEIYGVSTRVDAFEAEINAFIGDGGGGAGSCGDGTCGVGESCDGRTGTTACTADCAGKTGGKVSSRYCYVEGVCVGAACP